MKQTDKTIKLRITCIAARTCGSYFNIHDCLGATAARRQFKLARSEVSASGYSMLINGKSFGFYVADAKKLSGAYVRPYLVKIRSDFVPFTIELTPLVAQFSCRVCPKKI